jgi:hypothetical protein
MAPIDADLKVCRIASLTLVNAMIFQQVLAYKDERVEPLVRSTDGPNVAEALLKTWNFILNDIDYVPIFTVARDTVRELIGAPDSDSALRRLAQAASRITSKRAALRHDLMGRIYHRLLADAKYFGAFYTTVPAATLLLKLTLDSGQESVDWSDVQQIGKLRIADLACGTGTLLKATLQTIVENHVRACASQGRVPDVKGVHRVLVEKVLWGLDVVEFAIHLAGSALALHEPDVEFGEINLATLPIGGARDKLGSLDLLTGSKVEVQADLFGPASTPAKMSGKGDIHDNIELPQLDLCVMNPPFTRSVGGNLLFGHAPAKERARLQSALKKLVAARGIPANITAGLGSVFVALGHQKLNAKGRMALVLPRALLSGVAWKETRRLLGNNYHVKYIIVSHEFDGWNFSENTELSECLTISDWKGPEGTEEKTHVVNLWLKPRSSVEALTVASEIRKIEGADLEGQGSAEILIGNVKYGEVIDVAASEMRKANWNEAAAFAQTELSRCAHSLRVGQVYIPGRGIVGEQPTARFKDFADIGPDRRDIHDGFRVTDQKTEYPVFWGHDTTSVQVLGQRPNRYLMALAKAKKGRNLRDAQLLWSRSGRLLLAERLWLTTTRLVAIRMRENVLSNTWWPIATHAKDIQGAILDKIMALWFNSSLGLLTLIAARVDTRGAWVELKKPSVEAMLVLDPRKLSSAIRSRLCKVYDELVKDEVQSLPNIGIDTVRAKIDAAIAEALNIKDDFSTYRKMLATEPILAGRIALGKEED